MAALAIDSEIGRLTGLILHTPGPEIEAMTPSEAERDLYNDIIPLDAVRAEYDQLKAFLGTVTTSYELTDLLADTLVDMTAREAFLRSLSRYCPLAYSKDALMQADAADLARTLIHGVPAPESSLATMLDPNSFLSRPLPNTYFMRDSAAVVGDSLVSAATAFDVRLVESIITRFIFTHHPDFMAKEILFDGPEERNRYVTVEGGDIIVLGPELYAVGISERTTAAAVETIARRIAARRGKAIRVFAVELPRERATIHLDMVFTMIDRNAALIFEPIIAGKGRRHVIRIDASPDRADSAQALRYTEEESLPAGLRRAGLELETVSCAGGHALYQEREQWLSGANSFAFAPGKILSYSCNVHTLEALSRAGFAVVSAAAFIAGRDSPDNYACLAVTFDGIELARGGGGARCMTLPVAREALV